MHIIVYIILSSKHFFSALSSFSLPSIPVLAGIPLIVFLYIILNAMRIAVISASRTYAESLSIMMTSSSLRTISAATLVPSLEPLV